MSKPKLQSKCKLCNLIRIDRELWQDVHTRLLHEGVKKTHVCKWLNTRIDILNANRKPNVPEIAKFNVSNFTLHLKKHVSNTKQMKAELRAAIREDPRANDGFTSNEQDVAEAIIDGEQDALADSYKDYPATVAALEKRLLQDNVPRNVLNDAEKQLRILTTLIGIKRSLADVQRTEQVGGSAVRHALVRIGEEVVGATTKLATELKETLSQQLPGSSLPTEVESMITSRLVETIKGVYPEILADIYKIYGIK